MRVANRSFQPSSPVVVYRFGIRIGVRREPGVTDRHLHGSSWVVMKPYLSIIIPVLDESEIINQTLTRLVRRRGCRHAEIIVVDGNPLCNTLNAIKLAGVKKAVANPGRGAQMNHGARKAAGDMLLFLHADTLLERGALEQAVKTGKRGDIAGGAFRLAIASDKSVFRVIEGMV